MCPQDASKKQGSKKAAAIIAEATAKKEAQALKDALAAWAEEEAQVVACAGKGAWEQALAVLDRAAARPEIRGLPQVLQAVLASRLLVLLERVREALKQADRASGKVAGAGEAAAATAALPASAAAVAAEDTCPGAAAGSLPGAAAPLLCELLQAVQRLRALGPAVLMAPLLQQQQAKEAGDGKAGGGAGAKEEGGSKQSKKKDGKSSGKEKDGSGASSSKRAGKELESSEPPSWATACVPTKPTRRACAAAFLLAVLQDGLGFTATAHALRDELCHAVTGTSNGANSSVKSGEAKGGGSKAKGGKTGASKAAPAAAAGEGSGELAHAETCKQALAAAARAVKVHLAGSAMEGVCPVRFQLQVGSVRARPALPAPAPPCVAHSSALLEKHAHTHTQSMACAWTVTALGLNLE